MNKKFLYALPLVAVMVLAGCTGTGTNDGEATDNAGGEGSGSSAQGVTVTNPDFDSSAASDSASGITLAELQKHDSASDCWMVIDGKVYDVSSYVSAHPGGDEILKGCGKEATELFSSEANGGHEHPASARLKLDEFLVGDFAG